MVRTCPKDTVRGLRYACHTGDGSDELSVHSSTAAGVPVPAGVVSAIVTVIGCPSPVVMGAGVSWGVATTKL